MELLQLQYFRKVARLEHMTKAAQELHIAQPALSKTISRLEKELGVPLFDRKGRHISLNEYGKTFLHKVESALTTLEEGRMEIQDLAGMEQGRISVATTNHKCFSEIIGSFIISNPHVKLQITQASEKEKVQQLRNGDIDFCITFPPIEEAGIEGLAFPSEEILLAVPHTHRFANRRSITLRELSDDPFICIKQGNSFRNMTDEFFRTAGCNPNIMCEVDEHAAVIYFIRAGIGVGFLPETLIEKGETFYHTLHIDQPVCQRTYQIAWLKGRYLSLAARNFRDFLVRDFTDMLR
ncbi:LysR family transcriptional regulator [Aneurinibacillus sp. REN35]|uniref:LysR family transcriptional regulator n=1 Tax=Aneurinibacillus sp. REN35 TaxID=3237286 RepID=UPI003527E111